MALFSLLLIIVSGASAEEECKPHRKAEKTIREHFGEGYNTSPLLLPGEGISSPELLHPGDCIFNVVAEDEVTGYLLSTRSKGRFDYFDYFVVYSMELEVLEVAVTAYRSTHGAGICQKKWLRQFKGYMGGQLSLGKEIDAVSGGTLSATSLVNDMQRCHLLMSQSILTP